ncbi:MAG TPA: hypothetical protein VN708_05515 [Terriglobales bacterium]|jgi:hypothetical protein|nr:hypothetical protein [Terriglobales bacterium]
MKEPLKKAPQPPEKKIPHQPEKDGKEEAYDKTIEDSFPASDPPSSIPDPDEDEDAA